MADALTFTAEQEHVLMHMLGIDDPSKAQPQEYRDYYCANPGDPELHELARLGLVRLYRTDASYEWFTTTDAGKVAARAAHRRSIYPKKKRIYLRFLTASDAIPDLTFKQFLTLPEFAEARRNA